MLAASVHAWFAAPENQALVARLEAAGVRTEVPPEARVAQAPGPLTGRTYVLTGTLEGDPDKYLQYRVRSAWPAVGAEIVRFTDRS